MTDRATDQETLDAFSSFVPDNWKRKLYKVYEDGDAFKGFKASNHRDMIKKEMRDINRCLKQDEMCLDFMSLIKLAAMAYMEVFGSPEYCMINDIKETIDNLSYELGYKRDGENTCPIDNMTEEEKNNFEIIG